MRSDRLAALAAGVATAASVGTAVWGYLVLPDHWPRWLVAAGWVPALWVFAELAQERGRDETIGRPIMTLLRWSFAWAGLTAAFRLGLRLAIRAGVVDGGWLPVGVHVVGLSIGVGMVLFGNALPTLRSPWRYPDQPFAWQQVHRFVGWAFVLGGLTVVGGWAMLSRQDASRLTLAVMLLVVVLSLGRKLASIATHADRSPVR